jgi:hypothetical protein
MLCLTHPKILVDHISKQVAITGLWAGERCFAAKIYKNPDHDHKEDSSQYQEDYSRTFHP